MGNKEDDKRKKLASLEEQLKDLKRTLPEHCFGTKGYIGVHRADPKHWELIEDVEDQIKKLKAELGE